VLYHKEIKLLKKGLKMKKIILTLGLFALPLICSAVAPPALTTYESNDDTRAYVGVQWFLNETSIAKPNLVLGLRYTNTDSSNNVNGVDVTGTFSLEKMAPNTIRAGYIGGECDVQGTVGIGYSLIEKAPLAYAGVVGPYSKILGQIDLNKKLDLGIELNTQKCEGHRKESTVGPLG